MRIVRGLDAKYNKDDEGGFLSVDWHCPYCGEYNAGFYFITDVDELFGSFEVDHACDECGEMVTIECIDAEPNLFD